MPTKKYQVKKYKYAALDDVIDYLENVIVGCYDEAERIKKQICDSEEGNKAYYRDMLDDARCRLEGYKAVQDMIIVSFD